MQVCLWHMPQRYIYIYGKKVCKIVRISIYYVCVLVGMSTFILTTIVAVKTLLAVAILAHNFETIA